MAINVFGNSSSSHDNGNKIDTSLFVQKHFLRGNYLEADIEEDFDKKNQNRFKNLPDPISIKDACIKNNVINLFNDPSILKNTADVDFNDKNLDKVHSIKVSSFSALEEQLTPKTYVDQAISEGIDDSSSLLRLDPNEKLKLDERGFILLISTLTSPETVIELRTKSYVDFKIEDFSRIKNNTHVDFNEKNLDNVIFVKVNSMPAVREHLTPKYYVDQAFSYKVDESALLRLDPDEQLKLDEINCIIFNSILISPKTILELPTKSYVDSLHESSRNRRDLSSVFNDQGNEFDKKKKTKIDSVVVIRNPNIDNELSKKKYVDDSIGEGTIVKFIQTLENYLKVSFCNDTYILAKYDEIQTTDTTMTRYPKTGGYLLQN